MKERQFKSLIEVEAQKESEIIREDRRESSTVIELKRLATVYADQGNFDKAIKVNEEADAKKAKEIKYQIKLIQNRFQKRVDQLFNTFFTEIEVLENRLNNGLEGLNKKKDDEIINLQKNTSVVVQKLLLSAINDANKKVNKIELQGEITSRLTNYVKKKAVENGMSRKLQFD